MTDDPLAAERERVRQHLDTIADRIIERYGTAPSYRRMLDMLDDRDIIPVRVHFVFSDEPLQPGEFGLMLTMNAVDPGEGFILYIHPHFRDRTDEVPPLVAYQLVVAFGPEVVTGAEAEYFGARIMGMEQDAFYRRICELTDSIPAGEASQPE